jgi:hypothetical protein
MTSATHEALLKLIAERKAQVSRQKTIKPKDGRNRYRILPGWKAQLGDPRFYIDFGQHFIKDATGQVKAVYICVDKTFGRPCQVCETISQAILGTTDDATKKRLEDARSNARVLLNVLELDGPTPTIPQILEVAPSVFNGKRGVGGILGLFAEWPMMLDPANGHDIIIEKAGSSKNDTTYSVQIAGGSKPVPAEALTKLHDLDKFVQVESEEAMRRALTSVQSISGLLPASGAYGTGKDRPETPAPALTAPQPSVITAPATVIAQPVAPAPVQAPALVTSAAPTAAPVAASAPAPSTGDAELDKLLADLG